MPYKRRKREASQSGSPVLKKSMSLSSENAGVKRDGKRMLFVPTPVGS